MNLDEAALALHSTADRSPTDEPTDLSSLQLFEPRVIGCYGGDVALDFTSHKIPPFANLACLVAPAQRHPSRLAASCVKNLGSPIASPLGRLPMLAKCPTADDCRCTSDVVGRHSSRADPASGAGQAVNIAVTLAVQPLQTQPRDLARLYCSQ